MRARRFFRMTRRNLGANGTASIWFDMSKVEFYNCHRRGHVARECKSPRDTKNKDTIKRTVLVETSTSNALVLQYDGVGSYDWSFQADEEPTNYALMAFTSSSSSSSSSSDNETSSKNLSKLLESQITDKTSLGYDNQVFNSYVFDCDELSSSESDHSVPTSLVNDRYKSGEGYHVVPHPYTRTFMPPKPDLVFHDAPTACETVPNVFNVEPYTTKPTKDMSHSESDHSVPTSLVNDRYKSGEGYHVVPPPYTRTFMPPKPDLVFHDAPTACETVPHVFNVEPYTTKPTKDMSQTSVQPVEHPKQAKNLRTDNHKSRGHKHRWNRKACSVCKSLNHLIKDYDFYEKQMFQKQV
nr:hypothetical protein [Tanacetum cinerariifolium]